MNMSQQSSSESGRRIISEDEFKQIKKRGLGNARGVSNVDVRDAFYEVYKVSKDGVIISVEGEEVPVPQGEKVRVLSDEEAEKYAGQDWLYTAKDLWLTLAGTPVELKAGSAVAVLPADWQEQLQAYKDAQDAAESPED